MSSKAVLTRDSVCFCKKSPHLQDERISFMFLAPTQSQQAEEIVPISLLIFLLIIFRGGKKMSYKF